MLRAGDRTSSGRRPRRLRDSESRRRWRARSAWLLLVAALAALVLAYLAARVAQPEPLAVDPDGVTGVPRTYAVHNPWVLFAAVDDPRRVPDLGDLGCRTEGDLGVAVQPADMTEYGARVVDDTSIAAVALLGRSGEQARLVCEGAVRHAPLLLAPSSQAPPFAPSALAILGVALLVAAALAHPATDELPGRLRRLLSRSDDA